MAVTKLKRLEGRLTSRSNETGKSPEDVGDIMSTLGRGGTGKKRGAGKRDLRSTKKNRFTGTQS